MLVSVPVKVIVESEVPSPTVKASPPVPDNEIAPLVPVNVICNEAVPASTSLIEIRLPLPTEKTRAVSSLVDCVTGTVLIGASLTLIAELPKSVIPVVPVAPTSVATAVVWLMV